MKKRLPLELAGAALGALLAIAAPATAVPPEFRTRAAPVDFEQAPDWQPSGKRVVHHVYETGDRKSAQIHSTRLDGSGDRCLTCPLNGPNMVPTAQPHGEWVLFHSWNGHGLTIGAPGFGGLGSDLWVVRRDGGGEPVRLTTSTEGHDNFHAYWSPDGRRIVWTALNYNFVTEGGDGRSDIRVATFRDGGSAGPRLVDEHPVRPNNGHFYESQWWAPDGSGFLFTESVDEAVNNELFFCALPAGARECEAVRLTDDPAWDEQAIFTPDMKRILFMSTRDHPGAFNDFESIAQLLALPAGFDSALILPVFYAGFLQPVFGQTNDLYDARAQYARDGQLTGVGKSRRVTFDGDGDGWITPELAYDDHGSGRLLFTQVKIADGAHVAREGSLIEQLRQLTTYLLDPDRGESQFESGIETVHRTRIGRYSKPR